MSPIQVFLIKIIVVEYKLTDNFWFIKSQEKITYSIYHRDFISGVSNIRPAGQNRPVARLNPARRMIL